MKKILSIVLTVVMLGALIASAIPVFAADGDSGKFQIVAETINAEPGDTVELKIDLKNVAAVSELCSVSVRATWDSNLSLIEATYNPVCFTIKNSMPNEPVEQITDPETGEVEDGDVDWSLAEKKNGKTYNFAWCTFSPSKTNSIKDDITFVTIKFKVDENAPAGKLLDVKLEGLEGNIYDRAQNDVEYVTVDGGVQMPAAAGITLLGAYWDDLFYDNSEAAILSGSVDKKAKDPANRSKLDYVLGDVKTMTLRGWAKISTNAADIAAFGYSIDGAAAVYSANYIEDRAEQLTTAGEAGAQGFSVPVDVSGLKAGEHTVDIYVKDKNGSEVKLVKDRGEAGINPIGLTFTVSAPAVPTVQVITDSAAAMEIEVSNGVALSMNGTNLVVTTTDGSDPWVSVKLPELDISGYMSFTIKYKASATISTNHVYLKDTTVNPGYSPATGTWTPNKMGPTADFTTVSYDFKTAYPTMAGTKLTGIRIPTCSVPDGVFEIESITFNASPVPALGTTWFDVGKINGKVITIAGWTGSTYKVSRVGYTVDGGEPIFGDVTVKDAGSDVIAVAGENAVRFNVDALDLSGLDVGTHVIRFVAELSDEDASVFPLIATDANTQANGAKSEFTVEITDDSLKVTAVDKTAKAGETVNVDIKLADVVALASLKVRVTWPEELVLTNVEYNCLNKNDPKAIIHEVEDWSTVKGAYTFNWIQSEAEYQLTEDKNFVTLTFKVPEGAEAGTKYDIEIEVLADDAFYYNDNGVETDIARITQKNGSVTVVKAQLKAYSFNTVTVDGKQVCDVENALDFLAQNPIKGDVKDIALRGWAWVENCNIVSFGYKIDDGEAVFSDAYTQARPEILPILKAPSNDVCNGFNVTGIDVSKLSSGEHTITLLVKVDDNDQAFTIVEVPFEVVRSSKLHSMSFNTVTVDGKQVCDVENALDFLAQNPIKGDVSTIDLRGWAWVDESTIAFFGYRIDDGEAVFSDAYTQARPEILPILKAPSNDVCNGFNVTGIDVSNVAFGEHTITVLLKAADGNEITVVEVPFTKTSALLNVSYDELKYDDTQKFSESVDKKIAALEDTSVLDFAMGDVKTITVRGWARVSEDVNDIAGFGYSIDGGEVVTGDFIEDRAAELANANFPGAQGFKVVVPVEDLDHGEHSIDVYLITKAGKQIKVVKDRSTADEAIFNQVGVTFTVTKHEGQGGEDNPGTADVAVIAIAAVSVVALAGAFIGKKALKK